MPDPTPSRETRFERAVRLCTMLACGDLAPIAQAIWLRWHRLEHPFGLFVAAEAGHHHEHSGGMRLAAVLGTLAIPRGSVVIDFGVGTGIAALTLSRHFTRVIGVELAPDLLAAARRNADRMRVRNIDLHCADVREVTGILDSVTHIYMFNPFGEAIMRDVMANLVASVDRAPRALTLVYKAPEWCAPIEAAGFVLKRSWRFPGGDAYAVYERPTPRG